jgi:hypothetical protein
MQYRAFYNMKAIVVEAETPTEAQTEASKIFQGSCCRRIAVCSIGEKNVRSDTKNKDLPKGKRRTRAVPGKTDDSR